MSTASERVKRWRRRHPETRNANERVYNKTARARDPTPFRDRVRRNQATFKGHAPPPLEKDCPPRPADGCCECCFKFFGADKLELDHDHVTGGFRGWICFHCNTSIGKLGDTLDGVRLALDYMAFRAPR